ncbi:hypothetical protein PPTG_18739 [Phytophthora nicotianae INRA-310]|uniref:Uncharacterized protein n=1 Tax=Phytophthora nicotianae (strain INRA-310) TaxID=761204 RepID=W2PGX8_PHYN3|nr:hypothetical protein PPTG_18739 [Phytophthora nicotianae INRA-310]ETM99488.1 hypothetical protein PPTG_18739 [Phytophthora nicotianae INRA-310]
METDTVMMEWLLVKSYTTQRRKRLRNAADKTILKEKSAIGATEKTLELAPELGVIGKREIEATINFLDTPHAPLRGLAH